jgi:hypothetical protein
MSASASRLRDERAAVEAATRSVIGESAGGSASIVRHNGWRRTDRTYGRDRTPGVVSPDWCNSGWAVNENGHRVILASLE